LTPFPKPLRPMLKQLWDGNVAEREAKKKAQQAWRESAAGMPHQPHRVRARRCCRSIRSTMSWLY
jgi:hypothetical protein